MRRMGGHTDRIVTLDWNEHILASGSRRYVFKFVRKTRIQAI